MRHLRSVICFTFIIIQFFFTVNIQSQDTNAIKYLPLKVGNVWVYDHYILPSFHSRLKCQITGDTIIDAHLYFRFNSRIPYMHVMNSNLRLYRVDSLTGLVLAYNPAQSCSYHRFEIILDSLGSKINNIASSCPFGDFRILTDTSYLSYFGLSFKRKRFQIYYGQYQTPSGYLFGIGLHGTATGQIGEEGYNLYGCVINGIVYGDTSLTGINKISNIIPEQFSLSQNYPNPFNPTTKIRFSLPNPSEGGAQNVRLIVYDALGREVQTLVNEQLSPGTYEVDFPAPTGDGSNLPSGVYYYKLITEEYSQTKKMILIK